MLRLAIEIIIYTIDRTISLLLFLVPFVGFLYWIMGEITGRMLFFILAAEGVYIVFCSVRGQRRAWRHSREAMKIADEHHEGQDE